MRVRMTYVNETINVCREHYKNPPPGAPPLGPVESATDDGGCVYCDDAEVMRAIESIPVGFNAGKKRS